MANMTPDRLTRSDIAPLDLSMDPTQALADAIAARLRADLPPMMKDRIFTFTGTIARVAAIEATRHFEAQVRLLKQERDQLRVRRDRLVAEVNRLHDERDG